MIGTIISWLDTHNGLVTAISTVVVALFTATIWAVALIQLRVTRQTERAYLSASGWMTKDQHVFTVRVRNNGKTPGELTHVAAAFLEDSAIPEVPKYEWNIRRRPFSPNEEDIDVFSTAPIPGNLTRPLVYGGIKYLDIWNREHIHTFVLRVHLAGFGVAGDIPDRMNPAYLVRT